MKKLPSILILFIFLTSCGNRNIDSASIEIYQTSSSGDKLRSLSPYSGEASVFLEVDSTEIYQSIIGFGAAFTESSAHLLKHMSEEKRNEILHAYFSEEGNRYSLTRTHMNSCDFSLNNYSYAPIHNDTLLNHFSIDEDLDDIIPMIKEAQSISSEGFKVIASPWTAPPWMKDNNDWNGGKIKKEFYASWALFFSKYAKAYSEQGIDIWAFTIENEPLGNDSHWESMHYSPQEMADFIKDHLYDSLRNNYLSTQLLVYDQNRGEELKEWATILLKDDKLNPMIYGTAVHWYNSTVSYFPESLDYTHELEANKHIINTEACIDAEIPHWKDDAWYWKKEATDWGYDWAKEENKHLHPKYVPVFRYARDIIGCLNHWVEGWVDWNMVLDQQGGPNHAQNWCIAPILVDTLRDEVYYTPLFYTLGQFSKFMRPGAKRIGFNCSDEDLMVSALKNPDGSVVIVFLNESEEDKKIEINIGELNTRTSIDGRAVQSIIIKKSRRS